MRPTVCQTFISFLLNIFNYLQCFVGVSIFLYSLWMLNDWNRHDFDESSAPWFVYMVMSAGVLMCLIAVVGHIASGIVNGCCLCTYAIFTLMLILVEATVMADMIFNKHWEEDLPYDATGHLNDLRAFIEANMDIVKWIAVIVVVVQAFSLLLAIILRATVPPKRVDEESDEDFTAVRQPLLNPHGNLASASVDNTMIQADTWSSRMRRMHGLAPAPPSSDATASGSSNDQRKCYVS